MRFCDRYVAPKSRTHDQMVQAARSGVQNIAEGSQASGTSKKMELELTNVTRARRFSAAEKSDAVAAGPPGTGALQSEALVQR